MRITLDYYHGSGEVSVSFNVSHLDEEAIAIGFGATCEEAEKNLRWFLADSEVQNKRCKCNKGTPYMALAKKESGKVTKSDSCIDILSNWPVAGPGALTINNIDF